MGLFGVVVQAKAGGAEIEELALKFGAEDAVSPIAAKVASAIDHVKVAASNAASGLAKIGSVVGGVVGGLQSLWGHLFNLTNLILGGGLVLGFEKLIGDTIDFNMNLQKLSAALNGNTQAASAWLEVATLQGVQATMLARGFATFSKEAYNNAAVLRDLGVATLDVNGHLRSITEILADTTQWFHQHAGASNEAYLAQTLFGRGAQALLPILELGSAGLATLTAEAAKYGLIISSDTLERQLAFTYQIKAAEEAVHGLAINIGEALLPAVAAAGQGLSNFVASHLHQVVDAINRAVSFIIGIGEAFGFWDKSASDAAQTLSQVLTPSQDNYGDSAVSAAGAANGYTDAIKRVRDAAKDATQAIDDQIAAIDAQIQSLQEAGNVENFERKQTDIKQSEADKQKQIADLQQQYMFDTWAGDLRGAQGVQDQIAQLQADTANLEIQYQRNADDEKSRLAIEGLQKQKDVLGKQKTALNDAMQAQIDAMQAAATAGQEAMQSSAASIPPAFDQAGKDAAEKFKFALVGSAEGDGQSFGDKLKAYDWKDIGNDIGKQIGRGIASGIWDWMNNPLGYAPGEAPLSDQKLSQFAKGLIHSFGKQVWMEGSSIFGSGNGLVAPFGQILMDIGANMESFHQGGIVPGVPGSDRIILAQAGERVQTPQQQKSDLGPGATLEVLQQIARTLRAIHEDTGAPIYGQTAIQQTGG